VKLYVCLGLFAAAVLIKLLFPATFAGIGEKISAVVNYKAALATLGEGISGEKKFTAALGEAFTYAFTGKQVPSDGGDGGPLGFPDNAGTDGGTSGANDESVPVFGQTDDTPASDDDISGSGDTLDSDSTASSEPEAGQSFADAVIAAFMQEQEQYSDYALPAGVTYGMPAILIDYATPLAGVVSSSFGYRVHPTDGEIRFHYGTDIAADSGEQITAFADGKTIDVGTSDSLGNYVILRHGSIETQYAHCCEVYVQCGLAVKKGQAIAAVGATGDATNPHLHFELRVSGIYVNTEYYLTW
jgi:murein DD-endopeptidase MepM/ murein hydrolase activator NlpD